MAQEGANVMVQGRIVWTAGDLFKGRQKTDQTTKQLRVNQRGEPMMEYGFGLAVPKSVLNQTGPGQPGEVWAAMHNQALSLFPSKQLPPGFAMKYKDGDGVDDKGVPFSNRQGYAGCIVIACTTTLPIKFYRWEGGQNVHVADGIKCGDYVNAQLNIVAHAASGQFKAGLYVNPNAVQLVRIGEEIVNSPSGDAIFGQAAPPGMDYAPQMGAMPAAVPQMPSFGPVAAPQAFPTPMTTPLNPQVPVQPAPHYGVMPAAHQQPMQQVPNGYPAAPSAAPAPSFAPPQAAQGFAQPMTPGAQPPMMPGPQVSPSNQIPWGQPQQQAPMQPAAQSFPPVPGFGGQQ